jgi:predicted DsbA family dithiol-disulfide isomerase
MKVEIWSDFVCPFCYIGKRRFEEALMQFPHREQVQMVFKSFELDPNADSSARKSEIEMLAGKYGMSLEQAKGMTENVVQQAAAVGLHFTFENACVENTFHGHRLAHYAETQGKGLALTERLLKAHFTDNSPIGDYESLAALAEEVGLNRTEALAVLESGQYAEAVRADEEEASRLGVRGVPFFVFDRKFAVSGAQPAEVFLNALSKAWEERNPVLTKIVGDENASLCEDGSCVVPGTDNSDAGGQEK